MVMTINQTLSLSKIIRERLAELRSLRSSLAAKETYYMGDEQERRKEITPNYDVKLVDKKITELENFLFLADSTVKASNASTSISLDISVNNLLEPLQ
jgi:hypothetical protein